MQGDKEPKARRKSSTMGRIMTGEELVAQQFKEVTCLAPDMKAALGSIDDTFGMIVYGDSGNGKTSLLLKLIGALQPLGDALLISYEEGHAKSLSMSLANSDVDLKKIKVLDYCSHTDLVHILSRRLSAKIVVFDSLQYSDINIVRYKELCRMFLFGKTENRRKIFIFNSHAKGIGPDGKTAEKIEYDVMIKCYVKQFMAFIKSRFQNERNLVIWEQGAKNFYQKDFAFHKNNRWYSKPPKAKTKKIIVKQTPPTNES